jgi:hypothetical protein
MNRDNLAHLNNTYNHTNIEEQICENFISDKNVTTLIVKLKN